MRSLFEQSLLRAAPGRGIEAEVVVLANGCTDNTVEIATEELQRQLAARQRINGHVEELKEANRPQTWNTFIHHVSDPASKYIIMMDGDIYFNNKDSLSLLIKELEENSNAYAAATKAVKDVSLRRKASLFDKVCLMMTDMMEKAAAPRAHLTGGCYCGRADFWRRIILPDGMRGDDAFLSRMCTTNLLTTKPDYNRIALIPEATFVFEAYSSVRVLFRQHCRRVIGRYIEALIYKDLGAEIVANGKDGGEILRKRSDSDPMWLRRLLETEVGNSRFPIPARQITLRLTQLPYQGFPRALTRLPFALLGACWDALVLLKATGMLKKNYGETAWFDTRNNRLVDQDPRSNLS